MSRIITQIKRNIQLIKSFLLWSHINTLEYNGEVGGGADFFIHNFCYMVGTACINYKVISTHSILGQLHLNIYIYIDLQIIYVYFFRYVHTNLYKIIITKHNTAKNKSYFYLTDHTFLPLSCQTQIDTI